MHFRSPHSTLETRKILQCHRRNIQPKAIADKSDLALGEQSGQEGSSRLESATEFVRRNSRRKPRDPVSLSINTYARRDNADGLDASSRRRRVARFRGRCPCAVDSGGSAKRFPPRYAVARPPYKGRPRVRTDYIRIALRRCVTIERGHCGEGACG